MNKHITDELLETRLKEYGQIPQTVVFSRRTALPMPKRGMRSALILAAMLALMLLSTLGIGLAAHFSDGEAPLPPSDEPVQIGLSSDLKQTSGLNTTAEDYPSLESLATTACPDDSSPVTTQTITSTSAPPITSAPPTTEAPVGALPSWYSTPSVAVMNIVQKDGATVFDQAPIKLSEENGVLSYETMLSNNGYLLANAWMLQIFSSPGEHEDCMNVYCDLESGELVCLQHTLFSLLGREYGGEPWGVLEYGKNPDRCVFFVGSDYYFADLAASTVQLIEFDFDRHDGIGLSPDYASLAVTLPNKENDMLDDVFVIDLESMEIRQIFADAPVAGSAYYSTDSRFVYCFERISDSAQNGKDAKWMLCDLETGNSFEGEGKLYYVREGIALAQTEEGFAAYDCTTGEMASREKIPYAVDAVYHEEMYSITVYDPQNGEIVLTLDSVSNFEISADREFLFCYSPGSDSLICYWLLGNERLRLPLSEDFIASTQAPNIRVSYQLSVNADCSQVSIGYFTVPYTQEEADLDRFYSDVRALDDFFSDTFMETDNLPELLEAFDSLRDEYGYLIADETHVIGQEYLIWRVVYKTHPESTISYCGFDFVEDYRDGSFSMYRSGIDRHYVGQLAAYSRYEDTHGLRHRELKNRDYGKSVSMLSTLGEELPPYIDYANCYDEEGRFSDELRERYICSYDYLSQFVVSQMNSLDQPNDLEETLRLVEKYPFLHELKSSIGEYCKLSEIVLYDNAGDEVYIAHVMITEQGQYLLMNESVHAYAILSAEDYTSLLKRQGGLLYESEMYLDTRLAALGGIVYAPVSQSIVTSDFFALPFYDAEICDRAKNAVALYEEGGHSNLELLTALTQEEDYLTFNTILLDYVETGFSTYPIGNDLLWMVYADGQIHLKISGTDQSSADEVSEWLSQYPL